MKSRKRGGNHINLLNDILQFLDLNDILHFLDIPLNRLRSKTRKVNKHSKRL